MTPEIETANAQEPTVDDDVEATLRDVWAFLDDPVALLERALLFLESQPRRSAEGVTDP